jgi:hypothetical protein
MNRDTSRPLPRAEQNANLVRDWNDSRWSSWFRAACDERERRDYDPITLHPGLRVAEQIEAIYVLLPESGRYAMRLGLGHAVAAWNPDHYSFGVLSRLAWIVAQVHASEAVPSLLQILRDHRKTLLCDSRETLTTGDDVISILGGFVPDPETKRIESVFVDLLHDDDIAPHFTGTLAVAISTCQPELFARSFSRFYARMRQAPPDYFNAHDVLCAFRNAITKEQLYRGIEQVDPAAADYFISEGLRTGVVTLAELLGLEGEGTALPFPSLMDPDRHAERRYELGLESVREKTGHQRAGVNGLYMIADVA